MSQNQQKYTQKNPKLPELLPKSLILELTTRCNYSCPYCYCLWHEYPHLGRYVLRTGQWKQVIRYAVERNVTDFQFSGGEALLHPGIVELLNFTRKQLPGREPSGQTETGRGNRFQDQTCRQFFEAHPAGRTRGYSGSSNPPREYSRVRCGKRTNF